MRLIDADAMTSKIQKQYCEDCDRRKGENNGKRYMIYEIGDAPCRACSIDDMYAELDDAPTIQPEPHWIPVTERLPQASESVMICDAYGDICIGHRTMGGYYFPDFCDDKIKDVRAWMPLPESFEGVTE